jgi:hypothetical protein
MRKAFPRLKKAMVEDFLHTPRVRAPTIDAVRCELPERLKREKKPK